MKTPTRKLAAATPPPVAKAPSQPRKPRAARLPTAVPLPLATNGPAGKLGAIVVLMRRPEGATLAQMIQATGWQAHSVRGAIAGSLKKKHGLTIVSEPAEGGRVYRIEAGATATSTSVEIA